MEYCCYVFWLTMKKWIIKIRWLCNSTKLYLPKIWYIKIYSYQILKKILATHRTLQSNCNLIAIIMQSQCQPQCNPIAIKLQSNWHFINKSWMVEITAKTQDGRQCPPLWWLLYQMLFKILTTHSNQIAFLLQS